MPKSRKDLTLSSYRSMLNRCTNPKSPDYQRYGGRGISVCDRWVGPTGFFFFCKDLGLRPTGTTLDRIENNGDYSPSNCRWASRQAQSRNTRRNHYVELDGSRITLIEASERLRVSINTIRSRIRRGASDTEAISRPVQSRPHARPAPKRANDPRAVHRVKFNGDVISLTEAARRLLIDPQTVRCRLQRGKSTVDALLLPVRSANPEPRNRLCQSVTLEPYSDVP